MPVRCAKTRGRRVASPDKQLTDMPEDYYTPAPPKTGSTLRAVLLAGLVSFLGGAGLVGYLAWNGDLDLEQTPAEVQQAATLPAPPTPSPSPEMAANDALEAQVASLEARLARLNLQAAAFDGTSARAEGLLVAMATRRAIEQGRPLGYLEAQLRTRFGTARPDAVNTLAAQGKAPVTLDALAAQLDDLGPALLGTPKDESGWDRFSRELSGLFVIRRDEGETRRPPQRLDQARLLLRSGRIADAIAEVSKLPGSAAAKDWLANAQRYAAAEAALDQVEEAALTEPERLKGGTGEPIRQPGISASPAPAPTPAAPAAARPKP